MFSLVDALMNGVVKSSKRRGNTRFYTLENIGKAFGYTDVDVALIFSDIPEELEPSAYDESFINLCVFLKQLKDKGGEFSFDASDDKIGWGISIPELK